jgi:hypothetical protein
MRQIHIKRCFFGIAIVIVILSLSYCEQGSRSTVSTAPLESYVEAELFRLEEVYRLLDRYHEGLWPGWKDYGDVPVKVIFPNGVVLLVTPRSGRQPGFERIAGRAIHGKNVYINRQNRTSAEVQPPLFAQRGRGGEFIQLEMGQPDLPPLEAERSAALEARLKDKFRPEAPFDLAPLGDSDSHILLYIHEHFHAHQARLQRPGPVRAFKVNAEYAAWAHIEGLALHRAYLESQDAAAHDYLKDFVVAREVKWAHLPPLQADAAEAEAYLSTKEGAASYVSLKTAMLLRDSSENPGLDRAKDPFFYNYAYLDGYIDNIMRKGMDFVVSLTEDNQEKYYLYGAYQCFLLDRFAPGWKRGFLEKKKDLDSALAALLKLSSGEKEEIKKRLLTRYAYDEIIALHENALEKRGPRRLRLP